MTAASQIYLEQAYQRQVYLAVELLDAVTLTRVGRGMEVVAEGLKKKPVINRSNYFVWLKEGNAIVPKITVDPGLLPYEKREILPANVVFPLTTIELQPRPDYQFAPGITGLRGTVIERQVDPPVPVVNGTVRLQYMDADDDWQDSPTVSRTDERTGDFVSIIRLTPADEPAVENGAITVRLRVTRGFSSRRSEDFQLMYGRVTDPTESDPLKFAWDDMLP